MELRGFSGKKTVSGYFDDHEALAREAKNLDQEGFQVYVTLNEVNPDLLARAVNRVSAAVGLAIYLCRPATEPILDLPDHFFVSHHVLLAGPALP